MMDFNHFEDLEMEMESLFHENENDLNMENDNKDENDITAEHNYQPIKDITSVFGPGFDTFSVVRFKKSSKGRGNKGRYGRTFGKTLPVEISVPLSQAQLHYVNGNYHSAIELLSQVTKLAPKLAYPYYTMGMIYEESYDMLHALQFYALAASYTPKSYELWKKSCNIGI